jgi:hypothetical protein
MSKFSEEGINACSLIGVVEGDDEGALFLSFDPSLLMDIPENKLYILSNVGVSRSGKSLILNLYVSLLIKLGMARDFVYTDCSDKIPNVFKSADSWESVTQGAEVFAVRLRDGPELWANGVILLCDFQGLLLGDNPALYWLLAIATHISHSLVYVDTQFNNTFTECLGRIVGSRVGANVVDNNKWPFLNVLINKKPTGPIPNHLLNQFLAVSFLSMIRYVKIIIIIVVAAD